MTYVAPATDDSPTGTDAADPAQTGVLGRLGLHTTPPDSDGSERRRRQRLAVHKSVKLFDPVSGRYFAGHTCDVSQSGLCLELPAKLPARAGGTASLCVAGDCTGLMSRSEMLDVRFVWVSRDHNTGRATCGVELLADTAGGRNEWAIGDRPNVRQAA